MTVGEAAAAAFEPGSGLRRDDVRGGGDGRGRRPVARRAPAGL